MFELMTALAIASPVMHLSLPASSLPPLYGARAAWTAQASPPAPATTRIEPGMRGTRLGSRKGDAHAGRVGARRGSGLLDDGVAPDTGPLDPRDRFDLHVETMTRNQ